MLSALVVGTDLCAGDQDAAPSRWTMPEDQRQGLLALVDRAIAAGLPDAKGGALYMGTLLVSRTDEAAPAEAKAPGLRPGSGPLTYKGLHLKLSDGTWVVYLQWVIAGTKDVTVVEKDMEPIAIDQVMERARTEAATKGIDLRPSSQRDDLKIFAADQLPILDAFITMNAIYSLLNDNTGMAVPAVHLMRLGMPNAESLALISSLRMIWLDDNEGFWSGAPAPLHLLPVDQAAFNRQRQERFADLHDLRVPDPVPSLRRFLELQFLGQLGSEDPRFRFLPIEQAASAVIAMLDPVDPATPAVTASIIAAKGCVQLPRQAPAGADIATRLMSWGGPPAGGQRSGVQLDDATLERYAQLTDEDLAKLSEPIRTAVAAYRQGPRFSAADLGALVSLAGDTRPSRWIDANRGRTVGDNALHVMATVLGCDPRALIHRDVHAPWTDAERIATARDLAAWWTVNQKKEMADLIAGAIDQFPLSDLARLSTRGNAAQRKGFFDLLATTWAGKTAPAGEANDLAKILVAAKGHAGLDAVVAAWPVSGAPDLLLAAWHLLRGDGAPFDALLRGELDPAPSPTPAGAAAAAASSAMKSRRLNSLLAMAYRYPNTERLNRLLAWFSGPLDAPSHQPWLTGVIQAQWYMGDEISTVWGPNLPWVKSPDADDAAALQALQTHAAIPLALLGTLLNDQRPAPKELARQYATGQKQQEQRAAAPAGQAAGVPRQAADDLRVCDIAAVMFGQLMWGLHLDQVLAEDRGRNMKRLMSLQERHLDLTADLTARSAVITDLRRFIAQALPPALKAAGMPEVLPGITDVAAGGDDKSAF
jgi:hypothetical protein